MAELNYKANEKELETSFEPLPAGEYAVAIAESDYVDNKAGTGKILKLTYQVIDGPCEGRKIFENLNLENASKQAEQIAQKALNSICVAVGIPYVQDSAQLHGIPLRIDVRVKESTEYGMQNVIRKHLPMDGATPTKPAEQAAAPQGAASSGVGKKKKFAWEK